MAAKEWAQFRIFWRKGSLSNAFGETYVRDLVASTNLSLSFFILLNSLLSNCSALRSESMDAARDTSRRFCCACARKVPTQSSVTGCPCRIALIKALRHSLITAISSSPAFRKSLENPDTPGCSVSGLVGGVLAPPVGNVTQFDFL